MPQAPKTIYLKDYTPPDYTISATALRFDLDPHRTRVVASLVLEKQSEKPLVLNGEGLDLQSVSVDGSALKRSDYEVTPDTLIIPDLPKKCTLETVVLIDPANNTSLMGLYQSNGIFCTQCEAEGFRKITYYLDRPDVLSVFTVTIRADSGKYPILLANGNLLEMSENDGKMTAVWYDPHPKPCYLFALVAGTLGVHEDRFTTMNGREVLLRVYSEPQNVDQLTHAMSSVKKAMLWDEEHYGREYDLDIFNVVAVNDFNFGAMENKGLNIFNSKYILAKPSTATDYDYAGIDTVVAHEYFHNWSGDRVTCRDWFQISLKEGFTVFRDQSFDETIYSKTVHRINMVNGLRNRQFPEDAGPMAHPIRPESYIKIDNFYTATVYNKGAEVIRMMNTLLGPETFRKATDLYFDRFDGMAVTTDDFVACMQEASGMDFTLFKRWYSQAGTPMLAVTDEFDADKQQYILHFKQSVPDTPGQKNKAPMVLPIRMALLDVNGDAMPLNTTSSLLHGDVLVMDKAEMTVVFSEVQQAPVPSLLRHFSAPVKLDFDYTEAQLLFLWQHDHDGFCRWEAGQRLGVRAVLAAMQAIEQGEQPHLSDAYLNVFHHNLISKFDDRLQQAQLLVLPAESYVAEQMDVADPNLIHQAREALVGIIATRFSDDFTAGYQQYSSDAPYQYVIADVGQRKMKSLCLSYLMALDNPAVSLAVDQLSSSLSTNMTEAMGALSALANVDCLERVEALALFYDHWQHEPLVINKWLAVQASSSLGCTLESVKSLIHHPSFDIKNPNAVYALVCGFGANAAKFHAIEGGGYAFIEQMVLAIDGINPMVAARVVNPLTLWRRFDAKRQALMKASLERILTHEGLSKNVYEHVSKSLEEQ